MSLRVLVGGFLHETNTFAPTRADWAAFTSGETFPAYIATMSLRPSCKPTSRCNTRP